MAVIFAAPGIAPSRRHASMIGPHREWDVSQAWIRGEPRANAPAASSTNGVVGSSGTTIAMAAMASAAPPNAFHHQVITPARPTDGAPVARGPSDPRPGQSMSVPRVSSSSHRSQKYESFSLRGCA